MTEERGVKLVINSVTDFMDSSIHNRPLTMARRDYSPNKHEPQVLEAINRDNVIIPSGQNSRISGAVRPKLSPDGIRRLA